MRALRFWAPHDLRLEELPLPEPGPEDIRIRPLAVGLCGTDAHILAGEYPAASPVVLGHEVAGVVDAVGSRVPRLREGDLVTVQPNVGCGECRYCRMGREHLCVARVAYGVDLDGGLAEAQIVHARFAYRLPDGTDARTGCLTEPLACCIHAMDRLEPRQGLSLLLFGAGPAGCIMARLAHLAGLAPIVVVEPRANRRAAVSDFGADATVDPSEDGWEESVLSLSQGHGYDFVVEAVGSAEILESAVELAAPGARLLVFGVAPPEAIARITPYEIFRKELSLVGTVINPYTHERAVELLPHMLLDRLDIETYPLAEVERALQAQAQGTSSKVEISPQA